MSHDVGFAPSPHRLAEWLTPYRDDWVDWLRLRGCGGCGRHDRGSFGEQLLVAGPVAGGALVPLGGLPVSEVRNLAAYLCAASPAQALFLLQFERPELVVWQESVDLQKDLIHVCWFGEMSRKAYFFATS